MHASVMLPLKRTHQTIARCVRRGVGVCEWCGVIWCRCGVVVSYGVVQCVCDLGIPGAVARVEDAADAGHADAARHTELEVGAHAHPAGDARTAGKHRVVAAGVLARGLAARRRAVVGAGAARVGERQAVGLVEAGLVHTVALRLAVRLIREGVRILHAVRSTQSTLWGYHATTLYSQGTHLPSGADPELRAQGCECGALLLVDDGGGDALKAVPAERGAHRDERVAWREAGARTVGLRDAREVAIGRTAGDGVSYAGMCA